MKTSLYVFIAFVIGLGYIKDDMSLKTVDTITYDISAPSTYANSTRTFNN